MVVTVFWLGVALAVLAVVPVRLGRRFGRLRRYEGLPEVLWGLACSWGWPRSANALVGQLERECGKLHREIPPGVPVVPARVDVLVNQGELPLIGAYGDHVAEALAGAVIRGAAGGRGGSAAVTGLVPPQVTIAARFGVRPGRPEIECTFTRRAEDADPAVADGDTPAPTLPSEPLGATTGAPRAPGGTTARGPVFTLACSSGEVGDVGAEGVVVGTGGDVDWKVSGAGVSRRHARFRLHGGMPVVEDLGSTNGVWLDGQRIGSGPHALDPRSIVTLGSSGREGVSFGMMSGSDTTVLLGEAVRRGDRPDLGSGRAPWWTGRDETDPAGGLP